MDFSYLLPRDEVDGEIVFAIAARKNAAEAGGKQCVWLVGGEGIVIDEFMLTRMEGAGGGWPKGG